VQLNGASQPQAFGQQSPEHRKRLVSETLRALAAKLGELQAKLVRLDTHGDHLARLAGLRPQEFRFSKVAGRGGPLLVAALNADPVAEMTKHLDDLSNAIEDRSDKFALLGQVLQQRRVQKQSEPTLIPISGARRSSNFGSRMDPFTGGHAFHAGVDFISHEGNDVIAAAGGVVVTAEFRPDYGNMIDIDHGNGLSTRYGHASVLAAKVGDIVMQGQKIAEVGSTGRSTGPHLHFEVRDHGAAVNPVKYLQTTH
jgi:murein DD-endopeptidase MepM/ murein hydrolase activator NlpD